jgi:hypothetical protein
VVRVHHSDRKKYCRKVGFYLSLLNNIDADVTRSGYDVNTRFWHPKLEQGAEKYQLYIRPTATDVITESFLKEAIEDAYKELRNNMFKTPIMISLNEINEHSLLRIGHNFFRLFGEPIPASSIYLCPCILIDKLPYGP